MIDRNNTIDNNDFDIVKSISNYFFNRGISLYVCDAFEETILRIMKISEQPKNCIFQSYTNQDDNPPSYPLYVDLEISNSAINQVISYGKKYPELKLIQLNEINSNPNLKFIRMDAKAADKHFMPKIDTYLNEHIDILNSYRKASIEKLKNNIRSLQKEIENMEQPNPHVPPWFRCGGWMGALCKKRENLNVFQKELICLEEIQHKLNIKQHPIPLSPTSNRDEHINGLKSEKEKSQDQKSNLKIQSVFFSVSNNNSNTVEDSTSNKTALSNS